MKKILGLTVAALMVMGLVGGGTWAYFSDPETTENNVFTAGKLDISFGANVSVPFSVSNFVCGQTMSGSITIVGTGSSINSTLALVTGAFSEPAESQPAEFPTDMTENEVAGELQITVTVPDLEFTQDEWGADLKPWTADDTGEDLNSDPDVIYTGPVSGLTAGAKKCAMEVGDSITYSITVSFPADPTGADDNVWQGDGVEFNFTWTANQLIP